MTREQAIEQQLRRLDPKGVVITSNGKLGREVFELRKKFREPNNDFIMVGSMGCALPIALGVAMNTDLPVYCLLGDGNLIMKLGALVTFLKHRPKNLEIIVFNNDRHDSTGGQPTYFGAIREYLPFIKIIDVEPGCREDLGRPDISPVEIKNNFMRKCITF